MAFDAFPEIRQYAFEPSVASTSPAIRRKAIARLDVMATEASRTLQAIHMLQSALRRAPTFPIPADLANGLANARNWTLSLVISQGYLEVMLGGLAFSQQNGEPFIKLGRLAAGEGVRQASIDADRTKWEHEERKGKSKWTGGLPP